LEKADAEAERQLKQIDAYKDALGKANESIQKQNEIVTQQNEEMKKMAEDRNATVLKFNKLVETHFAQGNIARQDFVGWTGLPPVAVLFEYVFGLRPDVPTGALTWDVRLLEGQGWNATRSGKTACSTCTAHPAPLSPRNRSFP
jgi:hypothetical protein